MVAAQWFVNALMFYAAVGVIFAVVFLSFAIGKLDPLARKSSLGFRAIILPGVALLWPVLLRRWIGVNK